MATVVDLSGNGFPPDRHVGGRDDAGPAIESRIVTPHDANDLPYGTARGLHIGDTTGDVKITDAHGNVLIYVGLPADYQLNVRVKRVWATLTTATPIRALY